MPPLKCVGFGGGCVPAEVTDLTGSGVLLDVWDRDVLQEESFGRTAALNHRQRGHTHRFGLDQRFTAQNTVDLQRCC